MTRGHFKQRGRLNQRELETTRDRLCQPSGRKIKWPSRKRALTEANQIRAKRPDFPPLAVYRCRHCGEWHFTSRTEQTTRTRKG